MRSHGILKKKLVLQLAINNGGKLESLCDKRKMYNNRKQLEIISSN